MKRLAAFTTAAIVAFSASAPLVIAGEPRPAWSLKMRGLYRTLADLMTDVASARRFNDPANAAVIESDANRIAKLAHDLKGKRIAVPDADPSVRILAGMMAEQTASALSELKRGNRAYARTLLKSVPGYCIACHTRDASGPQFASLPFEPSPKEGALSPEERGEFYAATRQFDRALKQFIAVIDNGETAKDHPAEWSRAVHDSLAIAVRVKQSPGLAAQVASTVLSTPIAPVFERQDAKTWRSSIESWKRELPRAPQTQAGLYSELLRLMAKAYQTQKYPADRSGDVYYLRASAVAHELLAQAPHGKYSEEALLMAGLCYEVLSPVNLEDLHEIYYEACIRRAPHTAIAGECFARFERSAYIDYTGSGGLELPSEVRAKLRELGGLASTVKSIQK